MSDSFGIDSSGGGGGGGGRWIDSRSGGSVQDELLLEELNIDNSAAQALPAAQAVNPIVAPSGAQDPDDLRQRTEAIIGSGGAQAQGSRLQLRRKPFHGLRKRLKRFRGFVRGMIPSQRQTQPSRVGSAGLGAGGSGAQGLLPPQQPAGAVGGVGVSTQGLPPPRQRTRAITGGLGAQRLVQRSDPFANVSQQRSASGVGAATVPQGVFAPPGGAAIPYWATEEGARERREAAAAQVLPEPEPSRYFRNYVQQRAGQPAAYSGYDPAAAPVGPHIQYGKLVKGQMVYPKETQLPQSDKNYLQRHPSERMLPRVDGMGVAAYGTHRDARGEYRPVHGPVPYDAYFLDWPHIGQQYDIAIATTEPVPPDELQFLAAHGFTFGRKLGSGGFGTVWAVTTTRLYKDAQNQFVRRDVACKVMSLIRVKKAHHSVEEDVTKLLEESRIHIELRHPNVVECGHVFNIHDPVTGFPYVRSLTFMEMCDGDLLTLVLRHPDQRMGEIEAKVMFKQVTAGLKYLHDQNMVHLDLKPCNVLYIGADIFTRVFKLADFGLTRRFAEGEEPKITGTIGTTRYFPIELKTDPQATHLAKKMDIYSCATILAECLTGRQPFAQQGGFGAMLRELRDPYNQFMSNRWGGITKEGRDVLVAMTDPDPASRLTIDEVRQLPWFR